MAIIYIRPHHAKIEVESVAAAKSHIQKAFERGYFFWSCGDPPTEEWTFVPISTVQEVRVFPTAQEGER